MLKKQEKDRTLPIYFWSLNIFKLVEVGKERLESSMSIESSDINKELLKSNIRKYESKERLLIISKRAAKW